MLDAVALAPADRVLFLTIPAPHLIAEAAAALTAGMAAALGQRDAIYDARRAAAHLDNVMFTPAGPDEIPWQECFFSWVIDPTGGWTLDRTSAAEIHRVLSPGGHVWLANLDTAPLVELGLVEQAASPRYRLLRKPDPPFEHPPRNGRLRVL
jgi:hypothetical protein